MRSSAGQDAGGPITHEDRVVDAVRSALREDIGSGDRTTLWTVPDGVPGSAGVFARHNLVVAGTELARASFLELDADAEIVLEAGDGTEVGPGDRLLTVEGDARSILTAERTALNFMGRLSGISTLTRRFAEAIRGTQAKILDTRKTTPGLRYFEKEAVRSGGGVNHRMGLYDMILVKDNHIAAAGGLDAALAEVRERNRERLPVEIEVRTLEELDLALAWGADRILLDNMDVQLLKRSVARVRASERAQTPLEASGNVGLRTVRAIAETGVDFISVGAITHSAPAADLSLRVDP